ncbi:transglutaminase-like cysteine peptidase [Dongia sp.]|uniref:transglutaminase-like cysteine peptidase n=1 Tax=Dongia sp. TaxID=1977262 RepID=UPI0037526E2F
MIAALRRPALKAGAPFVFMLISLSLAVPAQARSYPNIFNSKEIASVNWTVKIGSVVQWNAMLKRWQGGAPCENSTCTGKGWDQLVAKVRAVGNPMAMIKEANRLMNDPVQHPYILDIDNWGKDEYWATTFQFLRKSGDCEDYAIAKYMLLKAVGYPVENMRIVTVRIRSLGGLGHAVLVVYEGSGALVLDNRVASVMDEKLVRLEFQPALSINELSWWVHLPGK